jgi:hypothetical protein
MGSIGSGQAGGLVLLILGLTLPVFLPFMPMIAPGLPFAILGRFVFGI